MHELGITHQVVEIVCPALFDLGEHAKVVIASVTEGDDKPIKYPHMFRVANLILLNKIDLLPYLDFDVDRFLGHAQQINPQAAVLKISATADDGLQEWYGWLRRLRSVLHPLKSDAKTKPASWLRNVAERKRPK